MNYLYLVILIPGSFDPQYFSTNSKDLALDKANEWLEENEELNGEYEIDVLRIIPKAPFTIERWNAIHGRWE